MRLKLEHPPPFEARIRKAIIRAKKLLRDEPEDISAGYRRGFADALSWVLGENQLFDRQFKTQDSAAVRGRGEGQR